MIAFIVILKALLSSIFIDLTVFCIYWLYKYTLKLVNFFFTVFKALTIFHIYWLIEMQCIYACAHAAWIWSLRSRKCLRNFEFKWVQERFLIGQVLGSQEMYRKFCPKMYQEMFLKSWHFLLPKTFRKFHILSIFPGLGNFIFLPVQRVCTVYRSLESSLWHTSTRWFNAWTDNLFWQTYALYYQGMFN